MAGNSGKRKNTMPLELAIQRELEYRRRVAQFQLHPNTNLSEEVKPPNDVSHPKLLQGPSSMKFSCLSRIKRKESPTRNTHHPHLKHQKSFHGSFNDHELNVKSSNDASLPNKRKESPTISDYNPCHQQQPFHGGFNPEAKRDDLSCKICKIFCSSSFNLQQHFKGHKHRQMLQKGTINQMPLCEVCHISCMNEDLLKQHFQGQKHKAKMQMLKISKQGGVAPNKQKWCELCKLWCIDDFAFRQHLEGKKHIVQKHAVEKK
ncbi:hypothetical protein VNO78_02811 [Psophocarpus tetragonolobus]|uniref:C2H2-type domain-containing protein n=1 Tax=Psophocarpus tetragonolobus TaxID=3891 RepID=A0AAN9XVI1_PSOTE